jgi:ABC-type bacteriocin/lantibiotic exporter with double-glycine peptidase domain
MRALVLAVVVAIAGCAPSYRGSSVPANPADLSEKQGWRRVHGVPLVRQQGAHDCGAAALASILEYWNVPRERLRASGPDGARLSVAELRSHARNQGMHAFAFHGKTADLAYEIERSRPVLVGVLKPYAGDRFLSHYQVVVGINPTKQLILVMDPASGFRKSTLAGFEKEWKPTGHVTMVVLRPDPQAYAGTLP